MNQTEAQIAPSFEHRPVAPLGLVVMPGCERLGELVTAFLEKWTIEPENADDILLTFPGAGKDSFHIQVALDRFGTGEGKATIRESVRGYDLYMLCDVTNYSVEYSMYGRSVPMSPDEHFMNLRRVISAAGGKARRVNVIMPYLYEGRQHRRNSRESLDCALALQDLMSMGVSNVITFDAHDPRVQNAVPSSGFESVQPTYQMLKALFRRVPDLTIDKDHLMVISPDEGAANRNIFYASMLELSMSMFYKRRDYTRVVNGRNPIVAHEYLGEDVRGKDILIADDILSTGESLLELARTLKKMGSGRVFLLTTFCLFTQGVEAFRQAHKEGLFDLVIGTNLNYLPPEVLSEPWFIQANMAKYIAYIIATLNHDRSVAALLNPSQRIHKLLDRYRGGAIQTTLL